MTPQFAPRRHRAQLVLEAVSRAYPTAWRDVDRLRTLRGTEIQQWPAWCYLPVAGAEAIVSAVLDPGPPPRRVPFERVHHIGIMAALAAWRVTQSVYRFDVDLAAALDDTPMPRELPIAALYRLPEWCIYLETPGLWAPDGRPLAGVWVHLESDARGADELRLLYDCDGPLDPEWHTLIPLPMILGSGSITDALERLRASGALHARAHGYRLDRQLAGGDDLAKRIWPIVSRVLYLCADDPDLGGATRPRRPQPVRTKDGWRLFPASGLTRWDVGVRIGAAIRRAQSSVESESRGATGTHASPRAHIRRAHWHSFWRGPRDPQRADARQLSVQWLPPLPINVEDVADLPATIRPVQE